MPKLLIHPPATTTSFTLNHGCGKPHEYDGEHGIDCAACAEYVAILSPEERIGHQHLRGPAPVQGGTPAEREAFAKLFTAEREAASWRLLPAGASVVSMPDPALLAENEELRGRVAELEASGAPDLAAENEALKARIAELEGAGKAGGPGRGKAGKA